MGITKLSIARPLTMLMIILGLVVLGYRSLTEMQVDRYPSVDFPFVSIVTVFPGAGPEDVEDLVVKPIEDAVAGISGIDQLFSTSQEGVGFVVVAFEEGVNGDDYLLSSGQAGENFQPVAVHQTGGDCPLFNRIVVVVDDVNCRLTIHLSHGGPGHQQRGLLLLD